MHRFDYRFLDNGLLPSSLVDVTSGIASLKTLAQFRKQDFAKAFTELERIARIQSVKGSNAIEGIITSDDRIAAIVDGNSAPLNHDEAEIAGYRDALALVHENHETLQFGESDILDLHGVMLGLVDGESAGSYKTEDNVIMEIDAQGRRSIRFEPVSASQTPQAMEQLVLAYRDARDNASINQLLLIPCVILDFLCIHPFKDGNGRMSRLLSLLLLYKNGFDAGKYISFEEQINAHKAHYYEALRQSSSGWSENKNDYFPFMGDFLRTLYRCYQELDRRFATVEDGRATKSGRIEAVVLGSLTPLSKADICQILPDVSPTTVEALLGKMVKEGRIRKIGAGRATRYKRVN